MPLSLSSEIHRFLKVKEMGKISSSWLIFWFKKVRLRLMHPPSSLLKKESTICLLILLLLLRSQLLFSAVFFLKAEIIGFLKTRGDKKSVFFF